MLKKIINEYKVFKAVPHNMQMLLLTNMLFALILPIVEIFVAAYIMRDTNSPSFVAINQLAMYIGIIFTSVINGFLLKYFKINRLYAMGILLVAVSLMGMMSMKALGICQITTIGFSMGAASGFFWTNRYLLTLHSTNDENRNYFFGFESFGFSVAYILVPVCIGTFIATVTQHHIFGILIDTNLAYRIVTFFAMGIAIFACFVLSKGKFVTPIQCKFLFFKYHLLWYKQLALAALKGLVQGFLATIPAILVMKFLGQEGSLGLIQSISGGLTAILVYVLGRVATPKHRSLIFGTGLVIFLVGTIFNGLIFSATGAIIFILCKVIFQPLGDLAYFPIMMKAIDVVSKKEKRNEYSYILSHEFGLFIGRAFGLAIFLILAFYVSENFALQYALIIVALIQILSIPLANHIIKHSNLLSENE